MKRLSLQWRITLMSVLLIGITCVAMNLLLCSSGVYYMDTIADSLQGGGTVILNDGGAASFDPQLIAPNEELTIVVDGVQGRFRTTNWYITAAVTLLSGILAYFVSGRALKPLRSFASQVEQVQLNNLADMRIDEDSISEFRQLSRSFNQMLERLNNAFAAQRQFTGNAAHELRTPLALMQAQLELFSAEHPDVRPETAEFLTLLREQTERLTQMTKTLLEMSNLQQVARNEQLQLAPMVEEIFTDLASLAEKRSITLEAEGDAALTGSDALIYRLIFNLTENAVKYNRPGGSVRVSVTQELEKLLLRVSDTGCGIPKEYQCSIFQPFFRVDKSRSREYGGVGLGLPLAHQIARLHGGQLLLKNVIPKHMECISAKLMEMGVSVTEDDDSLLVRRSGPLTKTNVKTLPYPGFPTDMQPQITAVLALAEGTSLVTEGVYGANRFKYVDELKRLGAHIQVDGKVAVVEGVKQLVGAPIQACDLRAGAALVIAGLAAQGTTELSHINYIERGYEDLVGKLRAVGADISLVDVPDEADTETHAG